MKKLLVMSLALGALLSAVTLNGGPTLAQTPRLATIKVKDINPGAGDSFPFELTNVGGTLFFRANDGASGFELWKTVVPPGPP